MNNYRLKEQLESLAKSLGLAKIRFLPAEDLPEWENEVKVRSQADATAKAYWEKRNYSGNYKNIMKDAKSFVIAAFPYMPAKDSRDLNAPYLDPHYLAYPKGRAAVFELANMLKEQGFKALVDPPLPIKLIAYKSGIGLFGKNGLVYNREEGSLMSLHLLLTDATFPYTSHYNETISDCGTCRLCIDTCPNNAIGENGRVCMSKCLRHYMLTSEIIPINIRERMGMRFIGCGDCRIVCPKNAIKFKRTNIKQADYFKLDIGEILENHSNLKEYLKGLAKVIGKNLARPIPIISMAIIAAGNSKDQAFVKGLTETLFHWHPTIRAHSAWALARLADNSALDSLNNALSRESEHLVTSEIEAAIKKLARL